ncbi:MAG: DPP IV N-terminal domain-containing protein [Marinifilaceae bacterium]
MRKLICLAFIALSFLTVNAQEKMITMEDAIVNNWRSLAPESVSGMQWRADKNDYTYNAKDYKSIVSVNLKGKEKTILTLATLNKALVKAGLKEVKNIYGYRWTAYNTFKMYANGSIVEYSIRKKKVLSTRKLAKGANMNLCAANNYYAYTKDNNLYVQTADNKELAVTKDTDKNIVNGATVSRSEFGIDGGIFWSPNGKNLAFYRKDESAVSTFPLFDITSRTGTTKEIKYPMAGMASENITLGVYNVATQKTVWVKPTDFSAERYLTNISWGAKGEYIYIQVLNREQSHMKLNKYDASTGAYVSTLLEEKDNRFMEPQHPLMFLKSNPENFIYQTNNRDGFNHFFLTNTDGKILKNLTPGDFEVEFLTFDKKQENIYYMSREVSPIENHLYKVNIESGEKTRLTTKEGWHSVKLSADKKYFIDKFSNINVPSVIDIVDAKGKVKRNVVTSKNTISDFKPVEHVLGKIKANDGKTDLYYKMTKPADFDANKKYPVIVYVYGGPHAQLVTNRWQGANWDMYMAQHGYVVFTLDNRGSAGRGKEFEACIHRQCGVLEMQDQLSGVDFLKSHPWVDENRIGVHGWSYGGFMTISLITNHPDVFKVAVAGGPVIDWKWYEVMYGERYMDTPQDNPEGYAATSLINKAKDLKGKLLICQGVIDNTVVWQHSLSFVRECVKNNVQVDYFPYPRAEHNVRGRDRIHLKQKCANYFFDYLK